MHIHQVVILLICLKVQCLHTNHLFSILVSEKNFYRRINSQVHTVTNKVFNFLNLAQEFTKSTKFQGLLAMHNDLNNIAEKHSSIYDDIQNITSFRAIENTTDLQEMFRDIIREEIEQHTNDTIENSTNLFIINSSDNIEDWFENFVNEVLDKITKHSTFNNDTINEKNTIKNKIRDIKVWKPQTSDEDVNKVNITRRLYKGKKSKIKKYPFLVSIHLLNEFLGAGSIISKDLVITAATCLQINYKNRLHRETIRAISVRIGSDYSKHHGELVTISEIYFHPLYDPVSLKNNIAILKMSKRFKFSKRRKIQRIHYDTRGDLDDDGSVTVLGWGAKNVNENPSDMQKLSVAKLDIFNIDECTNIYSRNSVNDDNFCAGFVSKGGGACMRDVGGPAIMSGKLVGIISFGPPVCGMPNAPTVFTKVSSVADWIDDVISQKLQTRKTKTRSTKSTFSSKPILLRAFSMPIITSPKPLLQITEHGSTEVAYPEELMILKDVLQHMVLSNNSVIDYILYGDFEIVGTNAKKLLTTTEKVDIHNNPPMTQKELVNSKETRGSYGPSSYEEMETGVKILESLVGKIKTIKEESKNIHRKGRTQAQKTTSKIKDFDDSHEHDSNDSSSYYEDGMSIESKRPSNRILVRNYDEQTIVTKASTKKSSMKSRSFKLGDFKNVIFQLNPFRESRDIIQINDNINKQTTKNKMKIIENNEMKQKNSKVKNDGNQRLKEDENFPTGLAMPISEEDDYSDDKVMKRAYVKRTKEQSSLERDAVFWRFRRRGVNNKTRKV